MRPYRMFYRVCGDDTWQHKDFTAHPGDEYGVAHGIMFDMDFCASDTETYVGPLGPRIA